MQERAKNGSAGGGVFGKKLPHDPDAGKESGREMRRKRSRRKVDTAWRKKRKKADYGSKSFN